MKKVNLRDLYPDVYKTDAFLEVTDEVQAVFQSDERAEAIRSAATGGGDHLSSAASDSGRVLSEVAADAVGKGICFYIERIYC